MSPWSWNRSWRDEEEISEERKLKSKTFVSVVERKARRGANQDDGRSQVPPTKFSSLGRSSPLISALIADIRYQIQVTSIFSAVSQATLPIILVRKFPAFQQRILRIYYEYLFFVA